MARPTDRTRSNPMHCVATAMLLASGVMLSSCATEKPKSSEQTESPQIPIVDPYNPLYVLLFDTNSAVVNEDGQAVLDQVFAEMQYRKNVQISLLGHADRSGPEDYNVALAQRRAEAVRAALIARGVDPRAIIRVDGRGESEPAVPTLDGVEEPGNRRVEINLQ